MFELGKLFASLAFPPGIILILGAVSVFLLLRRKRRWGILISGLSFLILYLFSITPIADLLLAPLEDRYAPLSDMPKATAIVVLGGGSVVHSPEYRGRSALTGAGLVRAAYGARLSRELGLPIIYSGGAPLWKAGTESEAEAASRFYVGIGIDPKMIVLETRSRNTADNADFVAALGNKGPLILVTSAFHMPRSVLSFKKLGVEAIPAPTDFRRNREQYRLYDFLPSASALEGSTIALHEYIGILYYLLT